MLILSSFIMTTAVQAENIQLISHLHKNVDNVGSRHFHWLWDKGIAMSSFHHLSHHLSFVHGEEL